DLYHRQQPGEERDAQPLEEPPGPVPDPEEELGYGPPATRVGGYAVQAGRPVPEAASPREGRGGRQAASRASPDRLRPPRDGGQDLRGDRRHHRLQPRNGEEPPEPRAEQLRAHHRTDDRL